MPSHWTNAIGYNTTRGIIAAARKRVESSGPNFDNDRVGLVRKLGEVHRKASGDPNWLQGDPGRRYELAGEALSEILNGEPPVEASIDDLRTSFARMLTSEIGKSCSSPYIPYAIGLKSTHLLQEIYLLNSFFTRARSVIMIRDPRDVLASNIARGGRKSSIPVTLMILSTILSYDEFLTNSNSSSILTLQYERLVYKPREAIEEVMNHFGLDPSRYRWGYLEGEVVGSNSSFINEGGFGIMKGAGIQMSSIGSFRTYLSPIHQYLVERLLSPYMERHGYKCELEKNEAWDRYLREVCINDVVLELAKHKVWCPPFFFHGQP